MHYPRVANRWTAAGFCRSSMTIRQSTAEIRALTTRAERCRRNLPVRYTFPLVPDGRTGVLSQLVVSWPVSTATARVRVSGVAVYGRRR